MASFPSPHFQLTSNQTALALVVPAHLKPEIDSLRRVHDKAFTKWEPHINILYPFVEPSHLSSAVAILRESLRFKQIQRVRVSMDEVGIFRHRKNATVFLKPGLESEGSICQLRHALVHALGCDERDGTYDGTFRPHLTVGQAGLNGTSIQMLVEQVEKLVGLDWEGRTLLVLKRELSGEMKMVGELPFGDFKDEGNDCKKILPADAGWRLCYSFTSDSRWNQLSEASYASNASTPMGGTPVKVKISTYNLMADTHAPLFSSRLQHIIQAISSTEPSTSALNVLCLQEINDEILPLLLAEPFFQTRFPFSTHTPSSVLPSLRNLVTLASRPFTYYCLQFRERHKTALVISFRDIPLEVANVHLTSGLTNDAVEVKRSQMENLTNFLIPGRNATRREIFAAGDFNLTTSYRTIETALSRDLITPDTAQLVRRIINPDIWEDTFNLSGSCFADENEGLFEGEQGATFDRLTNPLAAMCESPIDNRPQRYDRVLFRKGGRVHLEHFKLFGLPTEQGPCASDHYGVCVTLRIGEVDDTVFTAALASNPSNTRLDKIEVAEDPNDLRSLVEPYLPTAVDRGQREQALKLLQQTLTSNKGISDLALAPLGSYCMDTYFADSDVDLLAIGSVSPQVFFDLATIQLRGLDTRGDGGFKGVHLVNSLVSIMEVCVMGIKFDLQYCQAAELLERYHSTSSSANMATLVFDTTLISSLPPSAIRPLNTYRDTVYLVNSLPDFPSYRMAHRFLSLYLKRRGLYSAKFGYLGGIHLSLMLNRVVKLVAVNSGKEPGPISTDSSDANISPATIIRTFFTYYAAFNWAQDNVTDPSLPDHRSVSRSLRDSIFICSIHTPTARRNVASSCTRLSAQTLTQEFNLALDRIRLGDWQWCIRPSEASISDFINGFGAFILVQVDVWDVDAIGGDKVREMVGSLEVKFPRLLVALGRVSGLHGRFWPARFDIGKHKSSGVEAGNQFQGYYLAGVSGRDEGMDAQTKRLFTGKVITAVREFESTVKESREFEGGNIWVSMEVVPKKKILNLDLVLDKRDWGLVKEPDIVEPTKPESEELNLNPNVTSAGSNAHPKPPRRSHSTFLRPAQDIISRIHWDPALSVDDFVIGYEDRFVGAKEIELVKWKSEQMDDEFIPMHRIVWVRRKGLEGGEKVWDRINKVDLLFGSGITKGSIR